MNFEFSTAMIIMKDKTLRSAAVIVAIQMAVHFLFIQPIKCQNWISEVLINEYSNEKPWEPLVYGKAEMEPRSSVLAKIKETEFDPEVDDIDKEIENASQGNMRSYAKIDNFLFQNPGSTKRILILQIRARSGARAMAEYYKAIKTQDRQKSDQILEFSSAIRFLNEKSDSGDWISSLVLMRIIGELSFQLCETEFGKSEEFVKKCIEKAYKNGDKIKTDNAMKFEKRRLGWANRVNKGNVYPYAETGWIPNAKQ